MEKQQREVAELRAKLQSKRKVLETVSEGKTKTEMIYNYLGGFMVLVLIVYLGK